MSKRSREFIAEEAMSKDFEICSLTEGDLISGFDHPKQIDELIQRVGEQIVSIYATGGHHNFNSVPDAAVGYLGSNTQEKRTIENLYSQRVFTPYRFTDFSVRVGSIDTRLRRNPNGHSGPQSIRLYVGSTVLSASNGEKLGFSGVKLKQTLSRYFYESPLHHSKTIWEPYSLLFSDIREGVFPGKVSV